MQLLEEMIRAYPTVLAEEFYENEGGMNPAYQVLEDSCLLKPHQKKIWVLRADTDLTIAVGVKNFDYLSYNGKDELYNAVEEKAQRYLNLENRAGHPSLAVPEGDYDGSVYLAGWVCQRPQNTGKDSFIEIYLQSGRYNNIGLTADQVNNLKFYIARRFMRAYGVQDIIFYNFDFFIGDRFFNNYTQAPANQKCKFTFAMIDFIDSLEAKLIEQRNEAENNQTFADLQVISEEIEVSAANATETPSAKQIIWALPDKIMNITASFFRESPCLILQKEKVEADGHNYQHVKSLVM